MSEFSRGGQRGVWITHVGSFMFIGTTLNSALYWLAVPRNESNDIPVFEFLALIHGKYRRWNGSTVEISCWADLAQPSAGIKNSPKNLCSHIIFIVFFKF